MYVCNSIFNINPTFVGTQEKDVTTDGDRVSVLLLRTDFSLMKHGNHAEEEALKSK